jgi:hypothetical protein
LSQKWQSFRNIPFTHGKMVLIKVSSRRHRENVSDMRLTGAVRFLAFSATDPQMWLLAH